MAIDFNILKDKPTADPRLIFYPQVRYLYKS